MTENNTSQAYARQVKKITTRMERENFLESRPLSERKVQRIVKSNLMIAHPEKSGVELDNMVNQILPKAMRPYAGPAALKAPLETVTQARAAARKQQKKAMRNRRR